MLELVKLPVVGNSQQWATALPVLNFSTFCSCEWLDPIHPKSRCHLRLGIAFPPP